MTLWNILFSALFIVWLFVTVFLIWRIWRENVERTNILEHALADTALKSAETNNKLVTKLLEPK